MSRETSYNGIRLTSYKRAALAALAGFADGTTALTTGPLNGGALSALSMMGLAVRSHTPGEGFRYRISDAGREALRA